MYLCVKYMIFFYFIHWEIECVCLLFITEHCHCKNNVFFFTMCDLVGLVDCTDGECI